MSRLLAAVYDPFMRGSEQACLRDWRAELLADLEGDVLEIGAGTGASVPLYPTSLRKLVLSEPDRHMRRRLAERVASVGPVTRHVRVSGDDAGSLSHADGSFDAVVSFLVLCSVDDLSRALAEARRVLRPGGRFVFLEHVADEARPERLAWQHRVEPLWKRVMGNCHLTRRTERAIREAGLRIESVKRESMRKANPLARATVRGVAIREA